MNLRIIKQIFFTIFLMLIYLFPQTAKATTQLPTLNLPYFNGDIQLEQGAISWFGQVTPTLNYADIRAGFNDQKLQLTLHIIDRLLWYNPTPHTAPLTDYDSVSLYISTPTGHTYRFDAQVNHWQSRANYQAAYILEQNNWVPVTFDFTTTSGWRGNSFNDTVSDRGWVMTFHLPFASFALPTPPPGTSWPMALILHDRDDAAGTPIPPQMWPAHFNPETLQNFGSTRFNPPIPTSPPTSSNQTAIIRHKLHNQIVKDAHIGGHTTCGEPYNPNFFDGWGDANFAGYTQINIQNQWDVADWPCFSKYIVTFPLELIPPGKQIVSAELKLYQFGNAGGPGDAQPSYIHVIGTDHGWQENHITWNDAPAPHENTAASWVDPLDSFPPWPGIPRSFDVTKLVSQAYQQGQPAGLYLYSTDGAYHSGKYFTSSDTDDWNERGRPTLTVVWGDPSTPLPGDFNGDDFLDFIDLSLFLPKFNQTDCAFNLIHSCVIDLFDFNYWVRLIR